jgi:hypothetical protein
MLSPRAASFRLMMLQAPLTDHKCLQAFAGSESGVYAGLDATGQKAA